MDDPGYISMLPTGADPNSGIQTPTGYQYTSTAPNLDPNDPNSYMYNQGNYGSRAAWLSVPTYYNVGMSGGDAPSATYSDYRGSLPDGSPAFAPKGFTGDPTQVNWVPWAPESGVGDSALFNSGAVYEDPNYGWMTAAENFNPQSGADTLGKIGYWGATASPMVATGLAAGAFAAGLAPSLGAFGPYASPTLKAGVNYALTGNLNPGQIAGSFIGGASGIPFASTVGGYASGMASDALGTTLRGAPNPSSTFPTSGGNTMPINPTYPNGYPVDDNNNFTMDPITVTASADGYPEGFPPGYESSGGSGTSPFSSLVDTAGSVLGGGGGGGSIDWADRARRAALFGSALNDYHSSNQYMDMATSRAAEMNPFGSQRSHYQDMLRASYDDPTSVLNDPAHKAIQERQMAALSAKLGASGYMGSGLEKTQLADYLATSDNQFLSDYQNRMAGLAGSNIGPGAAADLIKTGIIGSIQARSDALANAARALNPDGSPKTVINNNNTTSSTSTSRSPTSGGGATGPMDLNYLRSIYPNATVSGTDKYGNQVLTAGGKMIGYLTDNGTSFTPYVPGMSGETDTAGDVLGTGFEGGSNVDPSDVLGAYHDFGTPTTFDMTDVSGFDIGSLGLFDP